jgi:hypothetical protein
MAEELLRRFFGRAPPAPPEVDDAATTDILIQQYALRDSTKRMLVGQETQLKEMTKSLGPRRKNLQVWTAARGSSASCTCLGPLPLFPAPRTGRLA